MTKIMVNDNGKMREATPEEIEARKLEEQLHNALPPTNEERIADLQAQNEMLTQCILEMSTIVYK